MKKMISKNIVKVIPNKICVSVVKDFTNTPGAGNYLQGEFSGEEFRNRILVPAIAQAKKEGFYVFLDLDGTYGYSQSFLDEAFGMLSSEYSYHEIMAILILKCNENPELEKRIYKYFM